MAPLFRNKVEERLFWTVGDVTIYVPFQRVPLVESPSVFCVASDQDTRTDSDSKIKNFRSVSLIQPPDVEWQQCFATNVVLILASAVPEVVEHSCSWSS